MTSLKYILISIGLDLVLILYHVSTTIQNKYGLGFQISILAMVAWVRTRGAGEVAAAVRLARGSLAKSAHFAKSQS